MAAPIALASVSTVALAEGDLKTRLAHLTDEAAIRELHQTWLREVNAGGCDARLEGAVRRISAYPAGARDEIDIAGDGASAVGQFDCEVEVETPLTQDCTLAQMAHAQGHGAVRRTERRKLTIHYIKSSGAWQIGKVASSQDFR